jgi:MFS family permease
MAALVGLVLLLVETGYLYAALPETFHYRKQVEANSEKSSTANSEAQQQPITFEMVHRRLLNLEYLKKIMCAFSFLFSGMEFTLVFLTFDVLDFSHMQQGQLLGYMGIISALIQGGYVRRKVQTLGEKTLVVQGMMTCALGLYCLATTVKSAHPVYWLYAGVTCLAFTSGTVVNCLTSLASLQCHEIPGGDDHALSKGRALGEFRSFGQLGRALGPISTCGFYWVFGPAACYALGALASAGTAWVTIMIAPTGKEGIKKRRVAAAKPKKVD